MNREAQDTLLLFVGVMVLQVGITDLHLRYVKPVMQGPLILAGAILAVIAVVSILRTQRASKDEPDRIVTPSPTEHVPGGMLHAASDPFHDDEHGHGHRDATSHADGDGHADGDADDDGHGHSHAHMPRTAWLLALPLLVLTIVTPPSLGAYAAARGTQASIDAPSASLPPLPPAVDGAVDLTMTEYVTRALYAPETLEGATLRLTGFVLPEDDGSWSVARVAMSCCAADGRAVRVRVLGVESPGPDQWVSVVGRFAPPDDGGGSRQARIEAADLRLVEEPRQPYE